MMKKDFVRDVIQWDIKSWYQALSYWDNNIDWNTIENALELGGREGGLSLWLASKGKAVVCSDLSNVKETSEPLHIKHDLVKYIRYQDIDATNIPYQNHFDIIVFKSIIGGVGRNNNIELQKKVFQEIHKALKPGGKLLFAENLIASPIHQLLRRQFVNWGASWRYVSIEEIKAFLQDFSSHTIKSTGFLGAFGRSEAQRKLFATIDRLLLNKLCSSSWKYIGYGVAEK